MKEIVTELGLKEAKDFSNKVNYPVLIRPSYVLSGAAMSIVLTESELEEYLQKAIESQKEGNFAIVEVLSYCPTSWKTFGIETNNFLEGLKNVFVIGVY